jgi:hypothetical protein
MTMTRTVHRPFRDVLPRVPGLEVLSDESLYAPLPGGVHLKGTSSLYGGHRCIYTVIRRDDLCTIPNIFINYYTYSLSLYLPKSYQHEQRTIVRSRTSEGFPIGDERDAERGC